MNYYNNPSTNQIKLSFSQNLNILYMNILSLPLKLEEVEFLLSNLGIPIHILVLTETWIADQDISGKKKRFELNNYRSFHDCRKNQRGGGVAIYVLNNIRARLLEVINIQNVQFMVLDLIDFKLKIGVCYRPPQRDNLTVFEQALSELLRKHRHLILLGDMNIDLLKQNDPITKNYLNGLASLYFNSINKVHADMATRIDTKRESFTIIDHILSDLNHEMFSHCAISDNPLSDHRLILLNMKVNISHANGTKTTFDKVNYEKLSSELPDLSTNSFESFHKELVNLVNKNTIQIKPKSNKSLNKPWFDNQLKKLSRERDKFYKLKTKYPHNLQILETFKYHQRTFRKTLKNKKRIYYDQLIDANKGNTRLTWRITNEIINNRTKSSDENIMLITSNKAVSNDLEVASEFNEYFASVGSSVNIHFVTSNVPQIAPQHAEFNEFEPVTENQLSSIILGLKNCSSGYDKIKTNFIKNNITYFVPILLVFINSILSSTIFPDFLKISRLKPIYKDGSTTEKSNYRPISVTSAFSKIVEIIMSAQLTEFLRKFKLIHDLQFGFVKNSSTTNAAVTLIDAIIKNKENGLCTGCLFIDISKAFDCMRYEQLRLILKSHGIIGRALDLIMNYLSNRMQYVELNGKSSSRTKANSGLPQGSCLTILFLIYINPLFHLKLHGKLIMYADDSAIVYGATDPEILRIQMIEDLLILQEFLEKINMKINTKKTCFMLFQQKRHTSFDILNVNNEIVRRVDDFNYLGLCIDSNLNFHKHTSKVLNSISKFTGIVYRIKNFTSKKTLLTLYFAHMQSQLLYMLPVWGHGSATYLDKIQTAQNKVLKMILNKPRRYNTTQLYKEVADSNILMFKQLIEFETTILTFKIQHNMIHIDNIIPPNTHKTERVTRTSDRLRPPNYHSTAGRNSFVYKGITLFNNLPTGIRNSTNLQHFKKQLRQKYKNSFN